MLTEHESNPGVVIPGENPPGEATSTSNARRAAPYVGRHWAGRANQVTVDELKARHAAPNTPSDG